MLPKRRRRKVFQLGFGQGFVTQETGGRLVHCGGFDIVFQLGFVEEAETEEGGFSEL